MEATGDNGRQREATGGNVRAISGQYSPEILTIAFTKQKIPLALKLREKLAGPSTQGVLDPGRTTELVAFKQQAIPPYRHGGPEGTQLKCPPTLTPKSL